MIIINMLDSQRSFFVSHHTTVLHLCISVNCVTANEFAHVWVERVAEWYSSGSVYVGQQCFGTLWQETANTACFVANPNQLVRRYVILMVPQLPQNDKLNNKGLQKDNKRHIFLCRKL